MVRSIDDTQRSQGPSRRPRVVPHDLHAEESMLGAMLLSRDAIVEAVQICSSADFYKPAHAHVFDAVTQLYAQGEPADPVTVADELRRAGLLDAIGGPAVLISLQANTPAIGNAPRYARIVEEHALLRRLIGVASEIAELGYDMPEDVAAAVDKAETLVFQLGQRRVADTMAPLRDLLERSLDHLEALYERGESITGVPTGYIDLDERMAGLQPSNLIIVGARPSMGKTSFALGIVAHAAMDARTPVLMFSLEMNHQEITQRLLCAEARVDATRMRNGRLLETDWPKISHAIGRLGEAPIFVDDNPNLTIMDIRAKARRLKSREGLGLVVIDYLQLMTGRSKAENRQVEVSEISRGLKILARELEVPVIALSQLSRGLESRADKRPMLADLRESGCMPASTRILRADNGEDISLGELVLSQQQPVVWSLDEHRRLVPAQVFKAFPSGMKPVFTLELASGRSVNATANHPFLTPDGWARLDALSVGSLVAVPRRLPAPLRPGSGWSGDELALLGHLIGGGSIGPRFSYSTTDEAMKTLVEGLARRLFGIETRSRKVDSTWKLQFPSPYRLTHGAKHPMRNWLEPHGSWKAGTWTKLVPSSVFGLEDEMVALFLHHLLAADGWIKSRNTHGRFVAATFGTTSRLLVSDVQRLFLRLGIRSTIAIAKEHRVCRHEDDVPRDGAGYEVRIDDATSQARFLKTVGWPGDRGARIPGAPTGADGFEDNPGFDSDVFFDRVVEVTAVGTQPTFDVTIPGTHNFVADGIVAHNSLEQDADVVMFLYRDEIYNPESAERGTAEIIVSKHRNGPTGVCHLAFLNQYTRFANMARI